MHHLIAALLMLAASSPDHPPVEVSLEMQADGSRTLTHEIVIPAHIDQVWEAVATIEGWRTWAAPVARAVPGSSDRFETAYQPDAPPGGPTTIEQQWVVRERPHRVAFRTTRTPEGFPHAEAYRQVLSSIVLTPLDNDSTCVRLTGSGYPARAAGDALISFFQEGNRSTLQQLSRRFTAGQIEWQKPRTQGEEK